MQTGLRREAGQVGLAHRRPNVFPQRGQAHAKGFSLVWVLSCRWTCSTRLISRCNVSQYAEE
jgi:hypothetical protein